MDITEILSKCDHTLLSTTATSKEIEALLEEGIRYKAASVCIPPCYVKDAAEISKGRIKICTVIGFPNGYSDKRVKAFEASCAVQDGADEIDMVINIGMLKDKRYDDILEEIDLVKASVGEKLLKVIIETCLLTEEEKIKMCEIISASRADFIKTSTGFSSGGATRDDIALFAKHISSKKRIKAAGGISSLDDARAFIALGASRLGTSKIIKIVKNEEIKGGY